MIAFIAVLDASRAALTVGLVTVTPRPTRATSGTSVTEPVAETVMVWRAGVIGRGRADGRAGTDGQGGDRDDEGAKREGAGGRGCAADMGGSPSVSMAEAAVLAASARRRPGRWRLFPLVTIGTDGVRPVGGRAYPPNQAVRRSVSKACLAARFAAVSSPSATAGGSA